MASQIFTHARRIAFAGTSGLAGFAAYKSKTDPVHVFWDLDNTILCSITPIPTNENSVNVQSSRSGPPSDHDDKGLALSKCPVSPSNLTRTLLPKPPVLRHFDQVDDDFPYDAQTMAPNTRTYFRPGARAALELCSYFAITHVYTAAQESYTNNILNELDADQCIFTRVIHRDEFPQIVREGKDLSLVTSNLQRAILFDDKVKNFRPQSYENGIVVVPFTPDRVADCNSGNWTAYFEEMKEMSRLVGIAFWSTVHLSGDARKVVRWVRGGGWTGEVS